MVFFRALAVPLLAAAAVFAGSIASPKPGATVPYKNSFNFTFVPTLVSPPGTQQVDVALQSVPVGSSSITYYVDSVATPNWTKIMTLPAACDPGPYNLIAIEWLESVPLGIGTPIKTLRFYNQSFTVGPPPP